MEPSVLAVDLDGTLIRCTSFQRELWFLVRTGQGAKILTAVLGKKPITKTSIKTAIGRLAPELDYSKCLRQEILKMMSDNANANKPVVLITAASAHSVKSILKFLPSGVRILNSSADTNLKGRNKVLALREAFPETPFTYVGDSFADLKVFEHAETALYAGSNLTVLLWAKAKKIKLQKLELQRHKCLHTY